MKRRSETRILLESVPKRRNHSSSEDDLPPLPAIAVGEDTNINSNQASVEADEPQQQEVDPNDEVEYPPEFASSKQAELFPGFAKDFQHLLEQLKSISTSPFEPMYRPPTTDDPLPMPPEFLKGRSVLTARVQEIEGLAVRYPRLVEDGEPDGLMRFAVRIKANLVLFKKTLVFLSEKLVTAREQQQQQHREFRQRAEAVKLRLVGLKKNCEVIVKMYEGDLKADRTEQRMMKKEIERLQQQHARFAMELKALEDPQAGVEDLLANIRSDYDAQLFRLEQDIQHQENLVTSNRSKEADAVPLAGLLSRLQEVLTIPDQPGPAPGDGPVIFFHHRLCLQHKVGADALELPDRLPVILREAEALVAGHPTRISMQELGATLEMDKIVDIVHSKNYIDELTAAIPSDGSVVGLDLKAGGMRSDETDTHVSAKSLTAALAAAHTVRYAVDTVMRGRSSAAFCSIRPPGHHVGENGCTRNVSFQGFCLLNNVVIAAKHILATTDLRRVAIVDFDVHHGNGTQEALEGKLNYLFCSTHVWERDGFYPGTGGPNDRTARNIINVPLKRHATSEVFFEAFKETILPALAEFRPEFLLISAGFDGHKDDPTKGMKLTADDFLTVTRLLKEVADRYCQGRIVSILEGGYDLKKTTNGLALSARAHLLGLMYGNKPVPPTQSQAPTPSPANPGAPGSDAKPGN